jgi:hypothetical protein
MVINKSLGFTQTERLLGDLCDKSFLRLWSYPNPFKDDGHEFCDLLAVFENHVFIFFDREITIEDSEDKDFMVQWNRWKSKVIDAQIKTAHGAERYFKSGRGLYLDGKRTVPFPLPINHTTMTVHKIIIAHGAMEACKRFSDANVYGSLGIMYGEALNDLQHPFMINVNKEKPVHIFDSHNLPIVLKELDTVFDFSRYLDAKIEAIKQLDCLMYCGEEDLLAHYFLNYDAEVKRYFIGTKDKSINSVLIGEGEWKDFIELDIYKNKKVADKVSYFWDELIQKTTQNALDGTLMGDIGLLSGGKSAIIEMAMEPRFMRRALSDNIFKTVDSFPNPNGSIMRKVSFFPSFFPKKAYVLLQIWAPNKIRLRPDYRAVKQSMLEIACGSAKNKWNELEKIVGIAVDAPKHFAEIAEDFLLMDCTNWTEARRKEYLKLNKELSFFESSSMVRHEQHVTDFIPNPE